MRSAASRLLSIATLALAVACAPALREPPSVEAMADDAAREFARREPDAVRRAVAEFLRSAARDVHDVEGLIGATRARVWLAGREETEEARRARALEAVQSAQQCSRRAPADPRCDYWLAVALGVQARERRSTALDALPRIVDLLEAAIERDARIDHAGPHRVLALLLVRAPGWPSGPGDPDLGLDHARRAVAIAPDHPPNRLALGEALAATGAADESRGEYARAEALAREAAARGTPESREWIDEARNGASR